jgi:hypothetical protein
MHSLVYMLARTVITYTLFRSTRGAMKYGTKTFSRLPDKLKLWDCPRCAKMWSGDPNGEDKCGFCDTKLIARHYIPQNEDALEEEIMLAA